MDERLLLSGGDQERRLPIFKEIQDSIIDPLTFNLFFYDGKIKSGGEMGALYFDRSRKEKSDRMMRILS